MVAALIPIVAGKITDKLIEKSKDKLSEMDLKSKTNEFFKKKIEKLPGFNEEKKALKRKESLERDLKKSLEDLKKSKEKGNDLESLSKQLDKIKTLEDSIDEIDSAIKQKATKQELLQKEIDKRLNSEIDNAFQTPTRAPKKIKPIRSVEAKEIKEELPSIKDDFKSSSSLFSIEKKPRNIKNVLGRPKGSKNKQKEESSSIEMTPGLKKSKSTSSSILPSKGSFLPATNTLSQTTEASTRELKLMDLLLVNNNLQLEELEKLNKNIDSLSETMESNNSGDLLDLLKKPKNLLKTLAKSPVTKAVGIGAGITAGVVTTGYNVISPQLDQRSLKKQLDEQLASGQITKEEYDKQLSFSKSKNNGKSKGAATGAAIGLGIGALTGPLAPVAMPILAGAGSFAGNYLGGKHGEQKAMSDYLKTTAYLESGFNPNAKAGTSSASGMFQFTKGTWENMNKKYGLNYSLEDRFDPKKSAQMAALFASENKQTIEKGTKQKASGTDLYMGHFLGAQGAVNFLNTKREKGTEKAALDPRFKSAAESNRSIFYNKDGSPKTFNEVYDLMDQKYKKGQQKADEIISKHTTNVLPEKKQEEQTNENKIEKKPDSTVSPNQEPKKESIIKSSGTIVEKDIQMSDEEKKEFIKQQNLKRYKGTSYATAMAQSVQDTSSLKSFDSKVVDYDKSKEKKETIKMQESSKMLSSELSKISSNQPSPVSAPPSPSPKVQQVADDYISTSIRYYVNN